MRRLAVHLTLPGGFWKFSETRNEIWQHNIIESFILKQNHIINIVRQVELS